MLHAPSACFVDRYLWRADAPISLRFCFLLQYGVEKIKTIGNTYMVASGLPTPNEVHHCHNIAAFALGMTATLQTFAEEMDFDLSYKIGISSGAAVAGVIGTKAKFSYDLWGDTVNTASRMCLHCPEGQIQVTEQTFALLQADFAFEDRGTIGVKGKGTMHTYMLQGEHADNTWRSRAQKLTKPTVSISQTLRQKRTLIAAAERRRQAAQPRQRSWHGGVRTSTAKPEHVFSKPYSAALNFWFETNGEAREMEKDFQRERKREVQSFVQIFWLLTLAGLALYLELMEMFYFCVDDAACTTVCRRSDPQYTTHWGMQLGRAIKVGFFFPGIILFVIFTTNERMRFEHGLTKITFFFLLAIGLGLAVIVAFTSRVHSYVFLLLIFIINNFTLLQHGNLLLLNALLLFVFEILVISSSHVDRWANEDWYLSFTLEKLLPVTMVALACNYATERRYRAVFLKMRALRQQQDDYETEKHVTEELLKHALPEAVLSTLMEGRHPAVGSYGTLMFADICDFTSFSGSVTAFKLVEILNHVSSPRSCVWRGCFATTTRRNLTPRPPRPSSLAPPLPDVYLV